MTTFQLDECLDDADLAADCNATGLCTVFRYPKRFKQKPDDEMLPFVFARNTTLVTVDRTIVEDNATSITAPNPGIIVIQKKAPYPPMTSRRARLIIETLKTNLPEWPKIDWSTLYVEVNEEEVYICPLTDSDITIGRPFQIVGPNMELEIMNYIAAVRR